MFDVVLFRPEIPPNTGNIMRICANTGTFLHLIRPFAFDLDETRLRRAGLDYREWAEVQVHDSLDDYLASRHPPRLFAFTRDGDRRHSELEYSPGDALLFGPESDGLPSDVLRHQAITARSRIPMLPRSRSLNLSNAVAVVVFEAWRRQGFRGGV